MPGVEFNQLRELIVTLEKKLDRSKNNELLYYNLSTAQCKALVEIGRANGISLNDLAELCNLDCSTMSRTVTHLVNKHLVERAAAPKDRRYICILLTGGGRILYERIEKKTGDFFKNAYENIPEGKRSQVLEGLQTLLRAVKEEG